MAKKKTTKKSKKSKATPQYRKPETLRRAFAEGRIDHDEFLRQQRRLFPLGESELVPESEVKPRAQAARKS